tara:strand:- start:334 stop:903 length:570 start_codon:yes stop_codon:yes gene_type:complete
MIPNGLFTQIAMVILAFAIIATYIQPTFQNIGETQDDIAVYKEQREKVSEVTAQLGRLQDQIGTVSLADQAKLLKYMPEEIDTISVIRDMLLISNEAGVVFLDATSNPDSGQDRSTNNGQTDDQLTSQKFELRVEGTYSQIKNLFALMDANDYPLEVHGLSMTELEGGFLAANVTVVTYAFGGADKNSN